MSDLPILTGHLAGFEDTIAATRGKREELYKWFHQHPELSMEEFATSQRIEEVLNEIGFTVTAVGKTGKVGVLENGEGPVVAFRADFDALPIAEDTGLEYSADPALNKMHACGHDMHTTALLGAAEALAKHKDLWSGTFIALFQPGEETGAGAQDMADSGLADKIVTPDVVLGQHIGPWIDNYGVGALAGPVFATCVQTKITLYGRGSHGSMPHLSVDPVVLAAKIIMSLQTIVSRGINPQDMGVVTVGAVHGGDSPNTVPDSVEIKVSTRAYTQELSDKLNKDIRRIVRGECEIAGCDREPTFEIVGGAPVFSNHEAPTNTVMAAFKEQFGEQVGDFGRLCGSEDFPTIAEAWGAPYFYWAVGSKKHMDGEPYNHSPKFAPDLDPVLDLTTRTILAGVSPWLMSR